MAARVSDIRGGLVQDGWGVRRRSIPSERLLLDGVRLLVAIVVLTLALVGLAGTGTWVTGAGATPVDGPAAGLDA